ncbi:MAG: tetratricopeptide repeat protein [Pseudomonadota bacterium]
MKSPLVEALKQANGDANASETTEHDVPELESPVPAANEPTIDSDELTLEDSMVILPIDGPTASAPQGTVVTQDVELPPIELPAIELPENQPEPDDEWVVEADSPTDSIEPEAPSVEPPVVSKGPAIASSRAVGLSRIGRYTPILAIALVAGAAMAEIAYQHLGSGANDSNLAAASSLSGSNRSLDAGPLSAAQNRFVLTDRVPTTRTPVAPRPAPRVESSFAAPSTASRAATPTVTVTTTKDKAYDFLTDAFAAYESGDMAGAEAAYRRALQVAPQHPNALNGLAAILQRSGRHDEALQHYETLLSVEPNNMAAVVALLAGRDGVADTTDSDIKHLIQRHPNSAYLRFALGASMARQERWPEASYAFESALQLDQDNADYYFNLGVSLEHLGRIRDAQVNYQRALNSVTANSALNRDVVMARIDQLDRLVNDGAQP